MHWHRTTHAAPRHSGRRHSPSGHHLESFSIADPLNWRFLNGDAGPGCRAETDLIASKLTAVHSRHFSSFLARRSGFNNIHIIKNMHGW